MDLGISMHRIRSVITLRLTAAWLLAITGSAAAADEFETFLKPLFAESCVQCHGKDQKVKGKVNLYEIQSAKQFMADPKLITEMIYAIDAYDMPPEDEPELDEDERLKLLAMLKTMLREATAGQDEVADLPPRRLNRFQYNNSLRDIFKLQKDVFALPEKMMVRHDHYLAKPQPKMPDSVKVSRLPVEKKQPAGFVGVDAYPQDLRALHGFDNQSNQLSMSPLLLDAFLKLSVSILESPDFNDKTVGVWDDFFKEPGAAADMATEVSQRLQPFLTRAFRRNVKKRALDRYVAFTLANIKQGMPFTDAMKKATSAALSSPFFLYRYQPKASTGHFELASRLSYFLWGSAPDDELLKLAASGELVEPEVLNKTITRMLADPKIERFLDTFPAQWMQLENLMAATPDDKKYRNYYIDPDTPASHQMVLEPLLLFDSVFVENRPIIELISPAYSYRSEFLNEWYKPEMKGRQITQEDSDKEGQRLKKIRQTLQVKFEQQKAKLATYLKEQPQLLVARSKEDGVPATASQAKWMVEQAELLDVTVELSAWHHIGPFFTPNYARTYSTVFVDEPDVDLKKAYGDRKWREAKELVDGTAHLLGSEVNRADYLYRTIVAESPRALAVSAVGSYGVTLWLNGKKIHDHIRPDTSGQVTLNLLKGSNRLLMKVANANPQAFYFKAHEAKSFGPEVVAALRVVAENRSPAQQATLSRYYLDVAPELKMVREKIAGERTGIEKSIRAIETKLAVDSKPANRKELQKKADLDYDKQLRGKVRSKDFKRVAMTDPRYGGIIANAAALTMTSGPQRTKPISRGSWMIEVVFNDPPPPPPNDVPPLDEDAGPKNQTIREKFAQHRESETCASCHSRIDPLGFALENFDAVGRWRSSYENKRDVDASGKIFKKHAFLDIVGLKKILVTEEERFARAFTSHLLRFALSRELNPGDSLTVDSIVTKAAPDNFKLKAIIREVILSKSFSGTQN